MYEVYYSYTMEEQTFSDGDVFTCLAGTRNAILNTEARTVEAEVLSRRCVLLRLADFSYDKYQKALRQSAGAVVIILPKNMSTMPQDIVQVHHYFGQTENKPQSMVA